MKGMTHEQTRAFWRSQDWSLCDAEIARRTGRCHVSVQYARLALGIPIGSKGRLWGKTKKFREACEASRRAVISKREFKNTKDIRLAEKYGISRERVRQLRKKHGLPSSRTIQAA